MIAVAIFWTAPAVARENFTRDEIFEIQFRLDQMDLDAGTPDGVAGPRTQHAIAAALDRLGLSDAGSEQLLPELRKATASIEGILLPDGRRQLLVFTDQGTPLILTVMSFGRMQFDSAGTYIRDHEADGTPIYSELGDASVAKTAEMPMLPRIEFGYEVNVPAPPKGERLEVDVVTVWPGSEELATRTDSYGHVYLRKEPNPRYWSWQFGDDVSKARQGLWRMALANRGEQLVSRTMMIGNPDK